MGRAFVFAITFGLIAASCASFSESGDAKSPPPGDDPPDAANETGASADADAGGSDAALSSDAPISCDASAACERVVFATSTELYADQLGGITGAHTICDEAAKSAVAHERVKGRKFLAWLSDGAVSPLAFMVKGTAPYVLPTGQRIADDWTTLTDTNLVHQIDQDETGGLVPSVQVWTGTSAVGKGTGLNCVNWTSRSPSDTATVGSTTAVNSLWTGQTTGDCSKNHRIYCFQE